MSSQLEVQVNDPFDGSLLRELFGSQEDLKLTNPYASFPFREEEWIATFNKHSESCSLIFRLQGLIVGHTSFLPNQSDLFLCYVIIHPEYRGKGLAREMLKLSEEFCRLNYPHQELLLNVDLDNERARRLYHKHGYEVCAVEKDRFRMKKSLLLT